MIKKLLTITLMITMLFSAIPTYAATFTDVPTSHWAYSSIENMAAKGVVNGVGQGKFAPADKVAASEFIAMLTRCYYAGDIDQTNTADGWWFPYFETARENGLFSGVFGVYSSTINQPLSRSKMAQMIYNLLSDKGYDMPDVNSLNNISIPDVDEDNRNWQAIYSVYKMGYLKGLDSTGRFGGNETMDRAQACAVMERLLNGVDKTEGNKSQRTDNVSYQNDKFEVWAYDKNNSDSRERMISFSVVETKAETYAKGIHIGTIAVREKETDDYNFGFFIDPSKYKFYSGNENLVTVDKFGEVYMQSCPEPMQTITTYISVVSSEGATKIDVKINNTFDEEVYKANRTPKIPDSDYMTIYRSEMLKLVNEIREAKGVAPLIYDNSLDDYADARALDLISHFGHGLPVGGSTYGGTTSRELYNKMGRKFGENAHDGSSYTDPQTAAANIFNSWYESTGHRENMLRETYTYFSCSVTTWGTAVQIFD